MIRTQKDKKLQTLIEVCTDFASLSHTTSVHRPAEQVFALEGGGQPGGGDVRRGGPTAVEHTEGGGTTFVTGAAADVRSCVSHGL